MFRLTRRFAVLTVLAASLPTAASDSGDDFANNLFSDLAPLLALFGERVAQQFMSQSMGWADNIIFAMAPLGIITAIVGAIRVGGPGWLKAIIGRAREAYAAPELELLSSTSSDVCELWNGVTLVKVLGSPTIVELIYFSTETMTAHLEPDDVKGNSGIDVSSSCTRKNHKKYSKSSGRLQSPTGYKAVNEPSLGSQGHYPKNPQFDPENPPMPPTEIQRSEHHTPKPHPPKQSAPNISLNINESTSPTLLRAVAFIGVVLQVGVLLFDGFTTYYPGWKSEGQFLKNSRPIKAYAFPATAVGTILVVAGMLICAYVVESATEESELEAGGRPQPYDMRLLWLQKHGKVGDQLFDSYVIFARGQRTSIRTSRRRESPASQESQQLGPPQPSETQLSKPPLLSLEESSHPGGTDVLSTLTTVGTMISVIGFTAQFVGLRSMPWTATIAQLVATGVMTCLRASVRTAGLSEEPNNCKLPHGYELDWLATRLGDFQNPDLFSRLSEQKVEIKFWMQVSWKWHVITGWHVQLLKPQNSGQPGRANKVVAARSRLQRLTKWTREGSMAAAVIKAIEEVMNNLFDSDDIVLKDTECLTFEWPMFIEFDEEELYPFELSRGSTKNSWRVKDPIAVEAILSLWRFSLQQKENALAQKHAQAVEESELGVTPTSSSEPLSDKESDGIRRLLGPSNTVSQRDYRLWIYRGMEFTTFSDKLLDSEYPVIGFPDNPASRRRYFDEFESDPREVRLGERHSAATTESPLSKVDEALCVITNSPFEKICAQDMFSTFMWYVVDNIQSLVSKTSLARDSLRGTPEKWEPPSLRNPFLESIVKAVEGTGLGTDEEICMSIIPPLRSSGILEYMDLGPRILIDHVNEKVDLFKSRYGWGEAEKAYIWLYDTCLEYSQKDPAAFYQAAILLVDFSASMNDTAAARKKGFMLDGQHENQKSNLSTSTSSILRKVQSGIQGRAIIGILETAYKAAGNIKYFPEVPIDADYTQTDEQPTNNTLVQGLLEAPYAFYKDEELNKGLNEQNILGWTTLHCAIANISAENANSFLDTADQNAKDRDGRTPLHWAVLNGKRPWVKALLGAGSDKNCRDNSGRTPLHLAFMGEHSDIAKLLVGQDVDKDVQDVEGWTPLHWAVLQGSKDYVELLMRGKCDINAIDSEGMTPLNLALAGRHTDIAELLIRNGADKELRDSKGQAALHRAVLKGSLYGVKVLVEGRCDMNIADSEGRTPLHLASIGGNTDIIRLLIEKGADKEVRDREGLTALHRAVSEGLVENAEALIEGGCDIEALALGVDTPLNLAMLKGRETLIKMLVEKGADPNKIASSGEFVLYPIAAAGHLETTKWLLSHGANPSLATPFGWTALHWAVGNGHKEVAKVLLENGADPRAASDTGRTPLDMARSADMREILGPYL